MHCCSSVRTVICIAPSFVDCQRSKPWCLVWASVLGCPTCDVIVRQYVSSACPRISPSIVGIAGVSAVSCGASESTFVTSGGLVALLIGSTKCTAVLVLSGASIAKSGRLFSGGVLFTSLVRNLETAPAAGCFIPSR